VGDGSEMGIKESGLCELNSYGKGMESNVTLFKHLNINIKLKGFHNFSLKFLINYKVFSIKVFASYLPYDEKYS
jgi:hypothetical protein